MEITQNLFKKYDIRGKLGKELNSDIAYKLGQLFAYNVQYKSVVIGRDNRPSSKLLLDSFAKGLIDSGCRVLELEGVSTSPLLYFASHYLKGDGAVMVTGSHNPLEYNGFKLMLKQKSFYGDALKAMLNNPIIIGNGERNLINLDNEYAASLLQNIRIDKSLRIAWEFNNSATGRILLLAVIPGKPPKAAQTGDIAKKRMISPIFSSFEAYVRDDIKIPGEYFILNDALNGDFVHVPPDPCLNENLLQIKDLIIKEKCDLGFAFDGDGDRLVLIEKDGNTLSGDQLIYLFAQMLKFHANKKILIDVKASQILIDTLIAEGFEVIIAPSGHSLMKARIIEENAIFAGELSGHFIINDLSFHPVDDALYAALRLIEYLQNNPLIELPIAPIFKEYKIAKTKTLPDQVYEAEGLRKVYEQGFYLVRASNTEDYVLVKYEAMTEEMAKIIEKDLQDIIN